jgi:histidinol phosphatase-like enzyme (inositol monophosphatase family)
VQRKNFAPLTSKLCHDATGTRSDTLHSGRARLALLSDSCLGELTELANALADRAGSASLPYFRARNLDADDKGNDGGGAGRFDPVTVADRAAERAMRELLALQRPDDGVFGEEEARTVGSSGLTWVLDPIDGTRAFISGLPVWGTLIALDDGSRGRIGIVDQPYIGERFVGVIGNARVEAWMTGPHGRRTLHTRLCAGLESATVFTTDPFLFTSAEAEAFGAVRARARLTRYGTDCYAYALLAMGLVDLVIESGLAAYDIAAHVPIIEAAGGRVTDWQGHCCRWGGRVVAAGSVEVHAAALEILSQAD